MQGNKQQTDNSVTKTTKMQAKKTTTQTLYPTINRQFTLKQKKNK
jgi:hypothetical protein